MGHRICDRIWRVTAFACCDTADREFIIDVIASSENEACTKAFKLWREGKHTSSYSIFILFAVENVFSYFHKEWFSSEFNESAEHVCGLLKGELQ